MRADDGRDAGDHDASCDSDPLQSGDGIHSAIGVLQSERVPVSVADVLHAVGPDRPANPHPNAVVAAARTDNAVGTGSALATADAGDTDHPLARSVPSGIAARTSPREVVVVSGFGRTDGGDSARRCIAAGGFTATTRTAGCGGLALAAFSDVSSDDKNDRGRDHSRGSARRRTFAASASARRWWHSSHPRCVRTRVHSESPD